MRKYLRRLADELVDSVFADRSQNRRGENGGGAVGGSHEAGAKVVPA